jgi:hypothetical protein
VIASNALSGQYLANEMSLRPKLPLLFYWSFLSLYLRSTVAFNTGFELPFGNTISFSYNAQTTLPARNYHWSQDMAPLSRFGTRRAGQLTFDEFKCCPWHSAGFCRGEILMDVKWHAAFCNVTFTEYAGMTYRDYYDSPTNMLEAQLTAQAVVEEKFGVGCFIKPHIDMPAVCFASYFGMPLIEPDDDELPYVDVLAPLLKEPPDVECLHAGDPKTTGLMAKRWQAWQYYRSQGYDVRFGGHDGSILTTAHELSAGNILLWLTDDPTGAVRVLDAVTDADLAIRAFDESLCGATGAAYTGDDFAGLLSPEMFRRFTIPQYERIYAGTSDRFMHSELLHAEHLRLAKDLLHITCYHGAGCRNLTLAEMHEIMGHDFWTQLTPQELLELSPQAIDEKVKEYAHSGCGYVQLYPGRGTPDANMQSAIAAVERECAGGRVGDYV